MTGDIIKALSAKYVNSDILYKLANAYIFKDNWESDYFIQRTNGYCTEFEIKVSRSDFLADKKKVEKHLILENGFFQSFKGKYVDGQMKYESFDIKHSFRPNRFYYVVPVGMIQKQDVPGYAGLMYYEQKGWETLKEIKSAPFIHKEKLNLDSRLCKKFYTYWCSAKFENYSQGLDNKNLRDELKRLKEILRKAGVEYSINHFI